MEDAEKITFESLGLSQPLVKATVKQGFTEPYPIQIEAIPPILAGKDLLGIAQTGSGKTASFALPILEKFLGKRPGRNRFVRCLVLAPTRELAMQIQEVFHFLGEALPERIKSMAVYGGVSINPQMMKLSGTEILVATPGRLLDLLASRAVYLSEVDTLVLDEADKMLQMGFQEEVNQILSKLPTRRQNILFSATMGEEVTAFLSRVAKTPVQIFIKEEATVPELIEQQAFLVAPERKGPFLRYLLQEQNVQQALIFTSSIRTADNVVTKLQKNGIAAAALHGDKSQGARTEALALFKKGKLRILVATDLASRGIDIQSLPVVINYELPRSPKDYVHRIGRTGRAATEGKAYSLITPEDTHHFGVIQKKMGMQVPVQDTVEVNLQGF